MKIVINTDSHHTSHLEKIKYGILQARRAWLTPAMCSIPCRWRLLPGP